jgi:hypothetical protein
MAKNENGSRGRRLNGRRIRWEGWPLDRLMELRFCDLGLAVEGTWVEPQIERIRHELELRGLRFRPHFWLSDEWFSPDGVPGVAVPFYLAHPRLTRLERSQMLEVEGGTREECLRLLRHEVGHAIQNAYALHRWRRWQRVFGKASDPYPDVYRPRPASKRFVQHLDAWYAQSHPTEDFAETFAVWLRPRSGWRRRYAGWPALRKLELVDELMSEIASERPLNTSRARPDLLSLTRKTLGEHYREKRERYSVGFSNGYDRDLNRLFSASPDHRHRPTAASFLRRHRREIRERVSRWTGEHEFTLEQVLKEMTGRCRELSLRAAGPAPRLKHDFTIMLAVHTAKCLARGREWRRL